TREKKPAFPQRSLPNGLHVPPQSYEVLQAVDLLVQPGFARECRRIRVTGRVDRVRLSHVALSLHRPPPPESSLRLPGPGPARRHPPGHRMHRGHPHERAPPQRLLDPHAAPALRRRRSRGGVALPIPLPVRPLEGRPPNPTRRAVRRRSGVPDAVGQAAERAGLLRSGRSKGLRQQRVAEKGEAGLSPAQTDGASQLLQAETFPERARTPQHDVRRNRPESGTHPPSRLLRGGAQVAATRRRHSVRARLLRHRIPQTLLPRYTPLRDTGDDPEDQSAAGHERISRTNGPHWAGQSAAWSGHGRKTQTAAEQHRTTSETTPKREQQRG
ncbi:hypothetical protein AVEN_67774-2-1, partial [Araneus ventricosus]